MKRVKILLATLLIMAWGSAISGTANINAMSASELAENLSGIGQAKAEAIVEYRKQNGPFKSIEDLNNVRGIGEKLIAKNRNNITLNETPETK